MLKRILCLTLALMLTLPITASAAADNTYAADISGEITAWNAFDDATLAIFKGWAKDARLKVIMGSEAADAVLFLNGQKLLGLHDDKTGMGIFPGDLLITGSKEERQAILGSPPQWLVNLQRLPACIAAAKHMIAAVPNMLAPFASEERVNFEVKNVGKAAKRISYSLQKEEWAQHWPLMVEEALNALSENGADETLHQIAKATLNALTIEKKATLKRFLNKDGQDIAWQFTGTVSRNGKDKRTVTLMVGCAESGLYVKGRFPAANGGNDCRIGLSAEIKKQQLTLDGSVKRTYAGKNEQYRADAKLDLSKGCKGSIAFSLSPGGMPVTAWRLTPNFEQKGDTLHGTLQASMQRDQRKAAFALTADVSKADAVPDFLPSVTLSAHDAPEKAKEALQKALAPVVLTLLNTVPQEQRMLIMHALGRHGRTNGDALPPIQTLEDPNDPSYLVEEVQNP